MRQSLPSLLKTPHLGQKSSICESGKGDEGGRPSEASCLPRSAQSKLDYSGKWQRITRPVDHEVAGVWDMAGMWVGSCAPSRFAPALSRCPPSHLHLAPSTLFLLRRNRVLRPASAWDRGRVIHFILSSQFGYVFRPASMRSQHLLRRNLNLRLWIPRPTPATIKKPNRTGAIRQKGIRLLYEGESCH